MWIRQKLTGLLLFSLVFIAGVGLFITSVIWIREFVLLYGININSIVITASAFLIDFAAGSRLSGRLSDKVSNQTNLLAVLLLAVALYSLVFYSAIDFAGRIAEYFTGNISDDLFSASVYRLILAIIFLVPAGFAGGIYPVFSRLITRHVSQAGQKTGIIIALLSYGALAGILILSAYSADAFGFRKTLILAAILLVLNTILLKLISHEAIGSISILKWPMAMKVNRTGLLLKKQRVLEAEPKLVRTLLWIFTFEGLWTMVMILIWVQILLNIPDLSPIEIITGFMITGLLGFGTGSLIFMGLTTHSSKKFHQLGITYMATGVAIVISFLVFSIWGYKIMALGESFIIAGKFNIKPVIITSALLFLPVFLIGGTFPLASRLYPKRLQKTGQRVGFLNFIFISGAVAGLVTASYIFIPLFGVYNMIFAVSVISIFTGLMLFMRDSRYRRSFRFTLLILTIITCVLIQRVFSNKDFLSRQELLFNAGVVRDTRHGPASSAFILEGDNGTAEIYVNGRIMISSDEVSVASSRNLAFIAAALKSPGDNAYISGFGTGVIASELYNYGFSTIVVSEPHPEIISLSAAAFSDINRDVLTRDELDVSEEDARSLLGRYSGKFDIIIMGQHENETRPDLYTREFYNLTNTRLDSSGIFCRFVSAPDIQEDEFMALLKTIGSVFPNVSVWNINGQGLAVVASKDTLWDYCSLDKRYISLSRFAGNNKQSFEAFLGNLMLGDKEIRSLSDNAAILSSNKPVIFPSDFKTGSEWNPGGLFLENPVDYHSVFTFSENCVSSDAYTFNIINSYRKIILSESRTYPVK